MTQHNNDPFEITDLEPPMYSKAREAIEGAEKANEKFADGQIEFGDDTKELIGFLDSQWPYMHKPIIVSGEIYYAERGNNVVTGQDTFLMESEPVIDVPVYSLGFDIRRMEGEYVAGHAFVFNKTKDGAVTFPNDYPADFSGWAPVGETVVEPTTIPSEFVEDYLKYYLPGVIEDVDKLLAESTDIVTAIKALSKLCILHTETDAIKRSRERQAIAEYISSKVDVKTFIPYSGVSKGIIYAVDEHMNLIDSECHTNWVHILVLPRKFKMFPIVSEKKGVDDSSLVGLLADMSYMDADAMGKYKQVVIPLTDNFILESNEMNMKRIDTTQLD